MCHDIDVAVSREDGYCVRLVGDKEIGHDLPHHTASLPDGYCYYTMRVELVDHDKVCEVREQLVVPNLHPRYEETVKRRLRFLPRSRLCPASVSPRL